MPGKRKRSSHVIACKLLQTCRNDRGLGLAAQAALWHWCRQECKPLVLKFHLLHFTQLQPSSAFLLTLGTAEIAQAKLPLAVERGGAALQLIHDSCGASRARPCYNALSAKAVLSWQHVNTSPKTTRLIADSFGNDSAAEPKDETYTA